MITKLREADLASLAKNEEEIRNSIDSFTVEDALFLVQYLRGDISSPNEIPGYAVDVLLNAMHRHEGWYMIRCGLAPAPFIKDGRGYIFTDEQLGQKTVEMLNGCGFAPELHFQETYDEDAMDFLVRYGAKNISVNRGCNGLVIDSKSFPIPTHLPYSWGDSEMQLNATIADFIIQNDTGDESIIDASEYKMVQAFNRHQLYFVSTPENPSIPKVEVAEENGVQQRFAFIFSDMEELRSRYARRTLIIHREPGAKIFEEMSDVLFILNPINANIFLGDSTTNMCIEDFVNYNRILAEAKAYLGESKDSVNAANCIAEYPDICDEFLAGLIPEGFDYSSETPVTVEKYTAQMLQRIIAKNHVEAYTILSKMRTYPESIQKILTGQY